MKCEYSYMNLCFPHIINYLSDGGSTKIIGNEIREFMGYKRYLCVCVLTRRDREVVDFKRYRVKNYTELTNLMKMYRIQGYNGKYGSNPQGI